MITQKITYNKDTGNIILFQEYNNDVLTTEELYNEKNMVVQRNFPIDKSMVKLFFDNEYWYVLKKTLFINTMDEVFHVPNTLFSYRITKYKKQETPLNPIEENLVISLGSRIEPDSDICTQLCTSIDNDKAVLIIKELFKKELLKKHDLWEDILERKINNNEILIHSTNER